MSLLSLAGPYPTKRGQHMTICNPHYVLVGTVVTAI